jgi:hypothetical protein
VTSAKASSREPSKKPTLRLRAGKASDYAATGFTDTEFALKVEHAVRTKKAIAHLEKLKPSPSNFSVFQLCIENLKGCRFVEKYRLLARNE